MDSEKVLAEAQKILLPAILLAAQRVGFPTSERAFIEFLADRTAQALVDHPLRLQAPIVIVDDRT